MVGISVISSDFWVLHITKFVTIFSLAANRGPAHAVPGYQLKIVVVLGKESADFPQIITRAGILI